MDPQQELASLVSMLNEGPDNSSRAAYLAYVNALNVATKRISSFARANYYQWGNSATEKEDGDYVDLGLNEYGNYTYGDAAAPNSAKIVDCSHFVQAALQDAGIVKTTNNTAAFNTKTLYSDYESGAMPAYTGLTPIANASQIKYGDVILFNNPAKAATDAGHMGFVIAYNPQTGIGIMEGSQVGGNYVQGQPHGGPGFTIFTTTSGFSDNGALWLGGGVDQFTAAFTVSATNALPPPPPVSLKRAVHTAKSKAAQGASGRPDPLVLDLGEGIQTTSLSDGAHFDYQNDGFAEATGWVSASTGILVYDPNNLGYVTDSSQLLAESDSSGFQVLQTIAGEGISVMDSSSPAWQYLKVWVGGDGSPGSGTLVSLDSLGIVSINLSATAVNQGMDQNGAIENLVSTFTMFDGTTRTIADYSFETDSSNTWEPQAADLSPTITALPEIIGSGTVFDLRQAMARDSNLVSLIQSAVSQINFSGLQTLVTEILQEWTGANEVINNSATDFVDVREEYIVEQFRGAAFTPADLVELNSDGTTAAQAIEAAYQQIYNYVFGAIVAQGPLSVLWSANSFQISDSSLLDSETTTPPDFDSAAAYFGNLLATDAGAAANQLAMFANAVNGLGYTSLSAYTEFKSSIIEEAPDLGQILSAFDGSGSAPIEMGTDATSQILSGTNTGGFLFGFSGNDSFKSNGGNVLEDFGSGGNDVYEVASGDTIKDGIGGGAVWFNGEKLTGGQWNSTTNQFESPDFDYQVVNGNSLKIVSVADPTQFITIDNVPLVQNPDGSFVLSGGTYLGINLSTPSPDSGVPTYHIDRTSGYVQTFVEGYVHPILYGPFGPPDGLNVLYPPSGAYNLVFDDLNPGDISIKENDLGDYATYWSGDVPGYDYDIILNLPSNAYPNGGALLVRLIDEADPAGGEPILNTITFADGTVMTLGQLLQMPQVGLADSPTVDVDGSKSSIAQAGINATYQVAALQSNVSLTGFESSATSSDRLTFTSGVSESNLTFSQSGTDLLVTNLQTGAVLQVNNYLGPDTDPSVAKSIQFADGTSLSYADLVANLENGISPIISTGAELLDLTSTSENGDGTYSVDLSGAEAYLDNLIAANDPTASTMLAQFAQALQPLESNGLVDYQAFREHYVSEGQQYAWVLDTRNIAPPDTSVQYSLQYAPNGTWFPYMSGDVWLSNSAGDSLIVQAYGYLTLYGNASAETIKDGGSSFPLTVVAGSGSISFDASLNTGSTTFDGGTGDDVFTGGSGSNFFAAHGGNDVDNGGQGANTYFLSAGFGSVVIDNTLRSAQSSGPDVIKFDTSLSEDDIGFIREGNDLLITDDYGDQALVKGYFSAADSNGNVQTVGTIQFSDGMSLSASDMTYWADASTQTDSSTISAPADDTGGSTLVAWGTGSTVVGGSGVDTLLGGAGNDTLIAGTGDDYLSGKEGSNTYVFGLNIGNDIIDNVAALGYGTNLIQFVDGITGSQLSFSQNGDDLVITVVGGTGSITVKQFFEDSLTEGPNPLISEIVFGDGTRWSSQQLFSALETATDLHPVAWGLTTITNPQYGETSSYVTGTGNDVTLYGGDGYVNTIDAGSSANATLYAAASNGVNGYAVAGFESELANNIYTEGSNTEIHLGVQTGGDTADTIVFGTGNSDLFVSDNAGYIAVSNVTAGTNVLHFADDVSFQQLMNVNESWSTSVQVGGTYLAMENNSDGNWSWYLPYYVSFAGDGVSAVLADGHIFDTTFYRQWVDGRISVQYGSATAGQYETLSTNDFGSAALFAGNGTEDMNATGNTAWMFGGSGVNFFNGKINGLYSGGSGKNYIYAGSGTSIIDGGLGTSNIYLSWTDTSSALLRVDLNGGNDSVELGYGALTVQFGIGINSQDLSVSVDANNDLLVTVTTSGQTVTFSHWLEQPSEPNVTFTFHDGTKLSVPQIYALMPQSGASGDVTISAYPGDADLAAGSGNDTLESSYSGNETIETGAGVDTVYLNGGSHVITQGTGTATIINNAGEQETLVLNQDSGAVVYQDDMGGPALTIAFGTGITEADVLATMKLDMQSQPDMLTGNMDNVPYGDLLLSFGTGATVDLLQAVNPEQSTLYLPNLEFSDGTVLTPTELQSLLTVQPSGGGYADVAPGNNSAFTNGTVPTIAASDTEALFSLTGSDVVEGSASIQEMVATQGYSILQANGGNADLYAWTSENWVNDPATGNWNAVETPNLIDGGSGTTTITLSDGIALAQKGNSTMNLEGTDAVVLFDAGDGSDVVQNLSQNLTISLGGGLSWNDVSLEQDGNDLVLDIGSSGKIDLQNYFQYPGASIQLQMFEGSDSSRVHAELANLSNIVAAFEAAGPQTAPWSIENALTNLALTAETNQAYGGDVAAYYALNGTLGGLSTDVAQAVLKDPGFGSSQALTDPTQWQNGKYQLLAA